MRSTYPGSDENARGGRGRQRVNPDNIALMLMLIIMMMSSCVDVKEADYQRQTVEMATEKRRQRIAALR